MELTLSKTQIGDRDAKYKMNLDDEIDCLMHSRTMGVEDWRAKKYLDLIKDRARTVSTGCKKFEDYRFLLRLLGVSGREEGRIVEQNLQVEVKPIHSRLLNPISAMQDRHNYKGVVEDIERLRREGWRVKNLVIHGGQVNPDVGWNEFIWDWWMEIHDGLTRICRGGHVKLVFSREVSVSSLVQRGYHPHVHVLYLYKGKDPIERFERFLPGCEISVDHRPVKSVKGLVRYYFGVSTPRKAYRAEWSPETSFQVNRSLWEWMDEIQMLYYNRKRIGKFGLSANAEKSGLPSVNDENKIIEDNYIYEKPKRLFNRCGRRAGGERESTTESICRERMATEGGNGEVEHGGIHCGSGAGVSGISSWPEGSHAAGRCGGCSYRGSIQGVRRNIDSIHDGFGESGKSTSTPGWRRIDGCCQYGYSWTEAAGVGGSG